MFVFRKIWRDLLSCYLRFEIRPFALLPTLCRHCFLTPCSTLKLLNQKSSFLNQKFLFLITTGLPLVERGTGGVPTTTWKFMKFPTNKFPNSLHGEPSHLEFCGSFFSYRRRNDFNNLGEFFLVILPKIAPVYEPARLISIIRPHWKGLLPASQWILQGKSTN